MGWTRIDDEFPWHPKVRKAGPLATGLHVMALCYANKYLTDGLIERAVLTGLIDLPRGQQVRLAETLVAVGLWERVGDDYYIHDFLEYNPSRETVLAGRAQARVRMNNRRTSGEVREKFKDPVPTPVPTPVVLTELETLGSRSAPSDRATKVEYDEVAAHEYALSKGFSGDRISQMCDKFLNHHTAGGWKRTGGVVIKDRMAAWRTWVANELERNPPSENGPQAATAPYQTQAEIDAINAEAARIRAERKAAMQAAS